MNQQQPEKNLLDELSADAPVRRMRSRLDELIANPPRSGRSARVAWATAAALVIAFGLAMQLRSPGERPPDASTLAVLEMLEAPSVFERLRGVRSAADLAASEPSLHAALVARLELDESVNVRLSALDALLAGDPSASDFGRLVELLLAQETAIVQAHLGYQLRRRRLLSHSELQDILELPEIHREARDTLIRMEES